MMDVLVSPAMLGGIMACVGLSAWMLGRFHSDTAIPDGAPAPEPVGQHPPFEWRAPGVVAPDPVSPCQQAARAERQVALATAPALGKLHADVSAYRQQAQVFAAVPHDGLETALTRAENQRECRYLGLIGQPTCAVPESARPSCDCSSDCSAAPAIMRALNAAQPSASAAGFARV